MARVKILLYVCLWLSAVNASVGAEYRIIIDPGHGGAAKNVKDDRWDPITGKYLSYTNYGSQYKNFHEHRIVLKLARRIKKYLDLSQSKKGWQQFVQILQQFGSKKKMKRVIFQAKLSRTESWHHSTLPKKHPQVNDAYRLFDYPHKNQMQLGRLSKINQYQPYLVLSLHMTTGSDSKKSIPTMAPVLSPGFDTLNLLRKISLGKVRKSKFRNNFWFPYWVSPKKEWSQLDAAIADAWGYFNGARTKGQRLLPNLREDRSFRQNLITWKYRESNWLARVKKRHPRYSKNYKEFSPSGNFFKRERASLEIRRREKGKYGRGGDNYYASMELLRFIQYGMRVQNKKYQQGKNKINTIRKPYVSTYALPIYTNAITAMLELGFINNYKDRHLLIHETDAVAKCLAVGIYSLFAGMEISALQMPEQLHPQGFPLDFKPYVDSSNGNYFKIVSK